MNSLLLSTNAVKHEIETTSTPLDTFRSLNFEERYINIIGPDRLNIYLANGLKFKKSISFFTGLLSGNKEEGIYRSLISYEHQYVLVNQLKAKKVQDQDIKLEVPLGDSRIDVVANIGITRPFLRSLYGKESEKIILKSGSHAFEAKSTIKYTSFSRSTKKMMRQTLDAKAKTPCDYSHAFIPYDADIPEDTFNKARDQGIIIIRSPKSTEYLIQSVRSLKRQVMRARN